ncbi:MAG: pyruvate, phosphate dikinase [Planctomycetota bacterium]|jgi:pyruvate,orthophosphate dikinase
MARSKAKKPSARPRGSDRRVFAFGPGYADGDKDQKDLLGGKGANLAEMSKLGLPVPPGFTISTEVCTWVTTHGGRYPKGLKAEVDAAMDRVEQVLGKRFGDSFDPLLVSVRSGARVSMPGMMDTVLNLGLNDQTVEGLARVSGDDRFAWDAYRRFVQMYSDVVLGVKARNSSEEDPFRRELDGLKAKRGVEEDTELTPDDLRGLVKRYKQIVKRRTGNPFPEDPREQLWGAIAAVFGSWNNERAIAYRQMHQIPGDWGTAVSVVAMVFGNLGETSGTGVAFTRDPATGEKRFYGEYLANAQGEDVVAGLRTPDALETMGEQHPHAWKELKRIKGLLEEHYRDMQDLEFTIQQGQLFMLQCRAGKRTGFAAVRIACDLVKEGLITKEEALLRVDPEALNQLLQPIFSPEELEAAKANGQLLTKGLNAGPGAATGQVVFSPERAEELASIRRTDGLNSPVILARIETSPEDIKGMQAAVGILTARGGMTSHAALVARQMGKVCVAGAGEVLIDYAKKRMVVNGRTFREGDWISLDGTTGEVFAGLVNTRPSEVSAYLAEDNKKKAKSTPTVRAYQQLLRWADEVRTLGVRANADQGDQCERAVAFGAEGVGLCRTEHMFFGPGKIEAVREMILADDEAGRAKALKKLLPLQRKDFEEVFKAMGGRPVTIRTLDPPLHEFLPHEPSAIKETAAALGISTRKLKAKLEQLAELNPMLGHRGCRLGLTYPEITRTQARAIFEAAVRVAKKGGKRPKPEVMIPLIGTADELADQEAHVREIADEVFEKAGMRIPYLVGTMIELPRACLVAGEIAQHAEFFSFGTNDLTQTTYGISRDDAGKFIPLYVEREIYNGDPFASLDVDGVGRLMRVAVNEGKTTRSDLKLGICGEHGGDPASIAFCHDLGLAYVSCSPYRIPIARLAAAQAALRAEQAKGQLKIEAA